MKKTDKKGIFWFLLITFTITISIVVILWLLGISFIGKVAIVAQFTLAGAMLIPGISAFIVRKFITKEGFGDAGLKFGSGKLYLKTYIFIPILFIIIYGITAIFYRPDFSLSSFAQYYGTAPPPIQLPLMFVAGIIFSLTFAPIINSIFAFGEEFGWRGYLLPKLLPLGKVKALFISGIIWGLWHVPFILLGFHYGEDKILGALVFTVLVMFLGIYIGYLRLTSGSVFLASFAHGVFNSQFYGVWVLIFPNVNTLLGGRTGLIGLLIFLLVALWILTKKIKNLS